MNVRVTAIAISPLLNPLPTLRLWGEETKCPWLFQALEIGDYTQKLKWPKDPLEPSVSSSLSANKIGGDGRGEVVLISREVCSYFIALDVCDLPSS